MSDRGWAAVKFMGAIGLVALLGCAPWPAARADQPDKSSYAALVDQLGDPLYAKRCEAAERLLAAGLNAETDLRRGLENPDPEIARQCRWLLGDLFAADLRRRIDAFAADKQGKQEHALPYWDAYRKVVGSDRASRDFYLEMLKAEGPLLQVAAQGSVEALAAVSARWTPLMQQAQYGREFEKLLSARTMAASLLIFSELNAGELMAQQRFEDLPDVLDAGPYENDIFGSVLESIDLKRWLAQSASREPLRRILGHWALGAANLNDAGRRLQTAIRYNLKESLVLAAAILEAKEGVSFDQSSLAATAVALQGGKSHVAMLEPLLAKEDFATTAWTGSLQKKVLLGDIALAWMVELTGQDLTAYGMPDFKEAAKRIRSDPQSASNIQGYGFYSDDSRRAALAKWREYVAAHPLPKAPAVEIPKELSERLKHPGVMHEWQWPNGGALPMPFPTELNPMEEGSDDFPAPGTPGGAQPTPVEGEENPFAEEPATDVGDAQPQTPSAPANAPPAPPKPVEDQTGDPFAEPSTNEGDAQPQRPLPPTNAPGAPPAPAPPALLPTAPQAIAPVAPPLIGGAPFLPAVPFRPGGPIQAAVPIPAVPVPPLVQPGAGAPGFVLPAGAGPGPVIPAPAQLGPALPPGFAPAMPADPSEQPPTAAETAEDAPIANLLAEWADREEVRALKAAEELAAAGRYGQAARLLDEVLEGAADKLYLCSQKHRAAGSLRAAAEASLAALPKDGWKAYQTQCQVKARRMLAEAIAVGDTARVAAVADAYFFTPAGAEAALLAALAESDRGEFARAAIRLEKIRRKSPEAKRLEPQLSLRAAGCLLAAGDAAGASRVLDELQAQFPGLKPVVAGRAAAALPAAGNPRKWFEAVALWRGEAAAHGAAAAAGVPLLRGKAVEETPFSAIPAALREKVDKQPRDAVGTRLPSSQPVTVGRTAIFRSATRLAAVDLASGKVLWQSLQEDPLRWFCDGRRPADKTPHTAKLVRAVRGRLFDDALFGALACDGPRVFGIEGGTLALPALPRLTLGRDGRLDLDVGGGSEFNYLNAYDTHTGKLLWSLGGPPKLADAEAFKLLVAWRAVASAVVSPAQADQDAPEDENADECLSGASFLAPPTCWYGRVLAIVARKRSVALAEIDAQRGKVLAMLPLSSLGNAPEIYDPFGGSDPSRAILGGRAQSCVCKGGVAVCSIGPGRFVGVNLLERRILWACTFPEETAAANDVFTGSDESAEQEPPSGWLDTAVLCAGERAILMPRGADRLDAVHLATGAFQWSAPREDGVYCAAPAPDILLIVGRGSVRAVRPSDGKPLWGGRRIGYPGRGIVCGHGFLGDAGYCIPLSSGEVLILDAARGRIVGRSRALDGAAPGNLAASGEWVFSCGAYGAKIFPAVRTGQEEGLASGDAADRALEHAQRLLAFGDATKAAAALRACLAEDSSDAAKRMLGDALLDGLAADAPGCERLVAECKPLLSDEEQWPRILWEAAAATDRRGQPLAAMSAYLRCLDAMKRPEEAVRIDALHTQSFQSRAAVRLEELYRTANAAQRTAMDEIIAGCRKKFDGRKFIALFGWHTSAADARLELVRKMKTAKPSSFWAACANALGGVPQAVKSRLEADAALRRVLADGSPQQRGEAAAMLAAQLAAANRNDAAAWWYRRLRDEMGDLECLDGKTGKQLFEALKEDSPLRAPPPDACVWPAGKVRVEISKTSHFATEDEAIHCRAVLGRDEPCPRAFLDQGRFCARVHDAAGREAWTTPLAHSEAIAWSVSGPFYAYTPRVEGWWLGNLLVIAADGRVVGLDGYGRTAPVWSHAFETNEPTPRGYRIQPHDPLRAPAAQAMSVAAGSRAVCFTTRRGVTAVDPLTGKTLWTREDFAPGCDLLGDDEMLLVTAPETTEAAALRTSDGSDLGRRPAVPLENRLWTEGRKVVSFRGEGERPELELRDAWSGEIAWKQAFSAGAKAWLVASDEAAVFERSGRLSIVRLADGTAALTAQAEPADKCDAIVVLRSSQRYVLIVNGAVSWAKDAALPAAGALPMQGDDVVPVNGRVYAFDRGGKRLWATNVVHQSMPLGRDPELPILVFSAAGQRMDESKTIYYQKTHVLDARTGGTLYRRIIDRYGCRMAGVKSDPAAKKIEVCGDWGTLSLTFTDEPR